MRIALVGCRAVGTWPVAASADDPRPWDVDDRPLYAALRSRGAEIDTPDWDDPQAPWERYDLALIRSTWDYHHRREAFVAWAEAVAGRVPLWNPAEVVRWNTDKRYLRDLDVPQVDTRWIEAGEPLPAVPWARGFLKPVVGATAEHTLRFDADREGLAAARAHLAAHPSRAFLLQPYVDEVETHGERSAVLIAGEITHYVRKQPVPGDYRVQDDYGATDHPHAPSPAEEAFARHAAAAIPYDVLYARIDWLLLPTGPALVELELVEPCLFFRHGPGAADRLAEAVVRTIRS